MINVLWADDQTDLVETFKSLLESLSAKITTVKDGNEVMNKVEKGMFDLLLLDLKMPPGEWGGLWALEQLRKVNKKTPVIIISGEGTQNETIKALRLGAQDYVTKDKIQTDLLERIKNVMRDSENKMSDEITNHFPTIISLPYKRYKNTADPALRLHRMLEFFEFLLRLLCYIGICEINQYKTLSGEHEKFQMLIQSPSMGVWNQSRGMLSKYLPDDALLNRLNKLIDNNFSSLLVKIRNDIAHGSEPSDMLADQLLRQNEVELQSLVKKLWQNLGFEMLLPLKFRYDGTQFEMEGVLISGSNSVLPITSIINSTPLVSNHIYVKSEDEKHIDLFPFIIAEPSNEPSAWKIMTFDGVKIDKKITGDEKIRYIDIFSGLRNVTPIIKPVSRALPNFLTGL